MQGKITATIASALCLIGLLASEGASAQPADFGHHMIDGSWWPFGPLMMLAGLAILIGFIVLIVRLATKKAEDAKPQDNALGILRERYARGEISHAEYAQMKRNLDAEG